MSDSLLRHFYSALDCEIGLRLRTDNPQALIQRLHSARREANDETLSSLIVSISKTSPSDEVWISRKPKEETSAPEE